MRKRGAFINITHLMGVRKLFIKEFWLSFSIINFLTISLFNFVCQFMGMLTFGCSIFEILG